LHTQYESTILDDVATIFTIHNLTFQLANGWWNVPPEKKDNGRTSIPGFHDKNLQYTNYAKRGILYADVINTVSTQYAQEIMTKKFGQDLHRILQNRKDRLYGIVNGIDYKDYNPSTDPGLHENYDYHTLHLKTKNKLYLQKIFKLPENPKTPILGMVTRLFEQKGINIILKIIEPLMRMNLQIIIWGGGDKRYEKEFKKIMKKYPDKFAANLNFSTKHATRVYAGSDIILMPSRFEPCGLTQLEGLRYGAIPIVHEVGGLADTITDYNPRTHRGNGFVFKQYDPMDLLIAITRAVESHKHKEHWIRLVKGAMQQSFSWEIPAKRYVKLFHQAIKNRERDQKE
jgi:starch synthase